MCEDVYLQVEFTQTLNNERLIDMNNKIVLIIIAILLAPLAVFLKKGVGKDLIINIVLCFLLYLPAIVHAVWIVTK